MATLFLMVGLPATGKTTEARRLEASRGALRLTKDEWVKALHGTANPPDVTAVVEGRLVEVALRVLTLGVDVVLDFGLWTRDERTALRRAAADVGAGVEVRHLHVDREEQLRRVEQRFRAEPGSTWPMTDADLTTWAAAFEPPTPDELDGSAPLDDPPAGFATWDAWRAHRWPAAVPGT